MNQSITISRPALPLLVLVRMGDWAGLTGTGSSRSRRTIVLIAGIIALSIADLAVTIAHLRSVGMIEANPVAAHLIVTYQSVWILAAYKLITVGICVAALYIIRQRLIGEMAAWTSVAILAGMAIIWHLYSTELEDPAILELVRHASVDDGWLHLR